ncbi:MAG: phospholipase D-like domain-containing protein [Bacteriovoracaceae bacterium]
MSSAFGIETYFNRNPRSQYTEPYRHITRAGDNLEAVLIREIKAAKKSVYVAVLEFRLPLVAAALIERKKAGVDVRVILEKDYNFDILHQHEDPNNEHEATESRELKAFIDINQNGRIEVAELETRDAVYMLAKAKVPVMDDSMSVDGTLGNALMHHKFVIIDGKTTVVSTANFTMSCVHGDTLAPQSRGNPNSMVVIDSTPFASLFTEEFFTMWGNGRKGNFHLAKPFRGARSVNVGGSKITVQFSPTSKTLPFEQSTNGLIASYMSKAMRTFKAALFVFSEQKLVDILEKRHNAGVDVGVIIETKFAYRDYSELLDMLGLEMLGSNCKPEPGNHPWRNPIREGGMANLGGGDILHHKFGVVDGRYVLVGSHNWSDSANNMNDETFLVIENTSISDSYTQEYERVRAGAVLGVTSKAEMDIQTRKDACARKGLL